MTEVYLWGLRVAGAFGFGVWVGYKVVQKTSSLPVEPGREAFRRWRG